MFWNFTQIKWFWKTINVFFNIVSHLYCLLSSSHKTVREKNHIKNISTCVQVCARSEHKIWHRLGSGWQYDKLWHHKNYALSFSQGPPLGILLRILSWSSFSRPELKMLFFFFPESGVGLSAEFFSPAPWCRPSHGGREVCSPVVGTHPQSHF